MVRQMQTHSRVKQRVERVTHVASHPMLYALPWYPLDSKLEVFTCRFVGGVVLATSSGLFDLKSGRESSVHPIRDELL